MSKYWQILLSSALSALLASLPVMAAPQSQATAAEVTVVAVGDIMIGSSFPSESLLPPDDATGSFAQVRSHLNGDVVFGNLEGVLLDRGESSKCRGSASGRCFAFRMPERYGRIIRNAGFNLLSTANNHAGDFGDHGRHNTGRVLDSLGIHHAGQIEKPSEVFVINGIRYGFAAFSPNRNMMSINDVEGAVRIVRDLERRADIVIVSFHGGAEGSAHLRVPKRNEIFLGENRGNVHDFAHRMIDAGADLVLGHGPHVTRAVELYKDRFIAYSLGNFNTYGMFSLRGPNGIAPILRLKLKMDGSFIAADVVSTAQTKENGLRLDPEHRVFNEIRRLTELDFPQTGLRFENNRILRK